MLENSRDPIALHWPVIELAPVPGRPMLPVMRARSMRACAVRTPWWLWLTPIVHQNDTASPPAMASAMRCIWSGGTPLSCSTRSRVKSATNRAKSSNPSVCSATKPVSTAPIADEQVGQPVEQGEVGLRSQGDVLGGGHRRLGAPGIDDDDRRVVRVRRDAVPHDRVGHAEVGADEDDHVGRLEVGVGVGRRVEPERLLVGDDGRRHALAGVAVAVLGAHAELGQRAEQRHLLGRDLAGRDERDRVGAVLGLDRLHAVAEHA